MVNTEEFIKRLEVLLDYYGISASVFADTIGVQRSGLSHLLSGRNKPSLDFIMKIVERYPEVDLYWLLNGKGNFPVDKSISSATPLSPPAQNKQDVNLDLFSIEDNRKEIHESEDPVLRAIEPVALSGEIEKIVIFYKDGTFKNYNPRQ